MADKKRPDDDHDLAPDAEQLEYLESLRIEREMHLDRIGKLEANRGRDLLRRMRTVETTPTVRERRLAADLVDKDVQASSIAESDMAEKSKTAALANIEEDQKRIHSRLRREAEAREYGAQKRFSMMVHSATGEASSASAITAYSKKPSTIGRGQKIAESTSPFELQRSIEYNRESLARGRDQLIEATQNVHSTEGEHGFVQLWQQQELRYRSQAEYERAAQSQRKEGKDVQSVLQNSTVLEGRIRQDQERRGIKEAVKTGQTGSFSDEMQKLVRVENELVDTLKNFKDALEYDIDALGTDTDAIKKHEEQTNKLRERLLQLEGEHGHQKETVRTMEQSGMDKGGGLFAGVVSALSGIAGNLGRMGLAGADVYRYSQVTSEVQRQHLQGQFADVANGQYDDVRAAMHGDMAALRRTTSGMQERAHKNAEEMRNREGNAEVAEMWSKGGILSDAAIRAAADSQDFTSGGASGIGRKVTRDALEASGVGTAVGVAGSAAEISARIAPQAADLAKQGINYGRGIDKASAYLQEYHATQTLEDKLNYINDQNSQTYRDYFADVTMATRGLGGGRGRMAATYGSRSAASSLYNPTNWEASSRSLYGGSQKDYIAQKQQEAVANAQTPRERQIAGMYSPDMTDQERSDYYNEGVKPWRRAILDKYKADTLGGSSDSGKLAEELLKHVPSIKVRNKEEAARNIQAINSLRHSGGGSHDWEHYANLIASFETGNRADAYTATNSTTGAFGRYQIMPQYHAANFKKVTGEDWETGKYNPKLQDKYFREALLPSYKSHAHELMRLKHGITYDQAIAVQQLGYQNVSDIWSGHGSDFQMDKVAPQIPYMLNRTAAFTGQGGTFGSAPSGPYIPGAGNTSLQGQAASSRNRRERILAELMDMRKLQGLAEDTGIGGKEASRLTSMGVHELGAQFGGISDLRAAGTLARNGYLQSPDQYMQMTGAMSNVGGANREVEEMLKRAVAAGMDNSKNMVQLVSSTVELSRKSVDQGISTTIGAAEAMGKGVQSLGDLPENMRSDVALSTTQKMDALAKNTGYNLGNVMNWAELQHSFRGAEHFQLTSLSRMTNTQANLLNAAIQPHASTKAVHDAKALLTQTGLDNLFLDDKGNIKADAVHSLTHAVAGKVFNNAVAFGGKERAGVMKKYQAGRLDTMTPEERRFYNGMTSQVDLSGQVFGAANAASGVAAREDYDTSVGGFSKAGENLAKKTPAEFEAKELQAGEARINKVGGVEGLANTLKQVKDAFNPDKFVQATKAAADSMTAPVKTLTANFDASVKRFDEHIGMFNSAVKYLVDAVSRLPNVPTNSHKPTGPQQLKGQVDHSMTKRVGG